MAVNAISSIHASRTYTAIEDIGKYEYIKCSLHTMYPCIVKQDVGAKWDLALKKCYF